MKNTNITMDELLNASNPQYFKMIEENLFEIKLKVKKAMDQGVSPDEFAQYQFLLNAIAMAEEINQTLGNKE